VPNAAPAIAANTGTSTARAPPEDLKGEL